MRVREVTHPDDLAEGETYLVEYCRRTSECTFVGLSSVGRRLVLRLRLADPRPGERLGVWVYWSDVTVLEG
jgi:hypothetical protein